MNDLQDKILSRSEITAICAQRRARGERIVFTNGCFDILHAGHIGLLHEARQRGNFLVIGLNSDSSVRRLKGASRPINSESARALVLAALADVDAVCIFEEDTPHALIAAVQPHVHVKGGDYRIEDLPEAELVKSLGGEVIILPLQQGFSTTSTLQQIDASQTDRQTRSVLAIPARFGSTRFPGKPLALLGGQTVIERVVRVGLSSQADRPILLATDDERIANAVAPNFPTDKVDVVMTSEYCQTGTDRLAEAVRGRFSEQLEEKRIIVVNVQGDEPFINPHHINSLIDAMRSDASLQMATLATPIRDAAQVDDTNVVKVVVDKNDCALYFSRHPIPFERLGADEPSAALRLRHLGIYAYTAQWLLRMASLPPTPLEQIEKLEQLRALENGVAIKVLTVEDVVNIAIDTPEDLVQAERFLQERDGG